ncbi:aspartate aminotransferase family protein [Microbacterium sp. NPDC055357]
MTLHADDGSDYLDTIMGSGPLLLGHDRPEVIDAVRAQLDRGILYGNHPTEVEVAERVLAIVPHFDTVALINSGSEATHLAVRIARATTSRPLIVKFEGHYHGWIDPLFLNNQFTEPYMGAGLPPRQHAVAHMTADAEVIVCRYDDEDEIAQVFAEHGDRIAAVIAEPVPMNFGTFLPRAGYLARVRELCSTHGALLVFDEVLSGFRLALRGAPPLVGVSPDIAVYAKAIASGFSLAAVAGTAAAMTSITEGGVTPAGTYNGNPVATAAALATLNVLEAEQDAIYPHLEAIGVRMAAGLRTIAASTGAPLSVNQVGSVLQMFWGVEGVHDFATATTSDRAMIAEVCEGTMDDGIFIAPRGLMLLSAAHTIDDIDRVIAALDRSVHAAVRRSG